MSYYNPLSMASKTGENTFLVDLKTVKLAFSRRLKSILHRSPISKEILIKCRISPSIFGKPDGWIDTVFLFRFSDQYELTIILNTMTNIPLFDGRMYRT